MMTISERISAAGAVVALLALSACGGGTQSAVPAISAAGKSTTATFTISIPRAVSAQGAVRRPSYISPNTQSASITLVSVNGTASKQAPTVVNLTAASANCSSSTGTLVCKVAVAAQAGSDVFSLTLYSAAGAAGSQLSTGTVTATIKDGVVNTVPLTLNGVVAKIAISLSQSAPLANGTAVGITVSTTATDASGATIVGPGTYSPAIALTDSDTSGHAVLSSTSVTAPGTVITLNYDGSAALGGQTITIGATATGIAGADIVAATLSPQTLASQTVSGAAAFAVLSDPQGNVVAVLPTGNGVFTVPIATSATGILSTRRKLASKGRQAASVTAPSALVITPEPDECAPDQIDHVLYCMSFGSNIVSLVAYDPTNVLSALSLLGQVTTDAPSAGTTFSGATCIVCGIAYDPTDKAFIISTANGYELYPATVAATKPLTTVTAPISENFGYNGNTNQIFSPYYAAAAPSGVVPLANLDVINIVGGFGTWYDLLAADIPAGVSAPDAGAVDTKTGIAIAPEEASFPVYLGLIPTPGSSAFVATPGAAVGAPGGTLSMTFTPVTPSSASLACSEESYVAADSVADLAFFGAEYCSTTDAIAVGQLPSTAIAPTGFTSYVDAELPALPTAAKFVSPLDPHAAIVINIPGVCADCGVLFNLDKSYMAFVDLNKFLALAPASPNGFNVPSTTDLLTPGIVQYIPTNTSSLPSAYARARAAYRRAHPLVRGGKRS